MRFFAALAHALAGWMGCGAIMVLGRRIMPMTLLLVVHAILAPALFVFLNGKKFSIIGDVHAFIT